MKSWMWIALFAALLSACLGLGLPLLLGSGETADFAQVRSAGELLYTLDLRLDREVTVQTEGGCNVITVADGKIAVTDANCPDHYCMHRGFCSGGADIVCLPNKLVISFMGDSGVDGAVG